MLGAPAGAGLRPKPPAGPSGLLAIRPAALVCQARFAQPGGTDRADLRRLTDSVQSSGVLGFGVRVWGDGSFLLCGCGNGSVARAVSPATPWGSRPIASPGEEEPGPAVHSLDFLRTPARVRGCECCLCLWKCEH